MSQTHKNTQSRQGGYKKPGFWGLVATQSQGAFSDNLFQYLLVFFLLDYYKLLAADPATANETIWNIGWGSFHFSINLIDNIPNIASLLFSVPFIVFPAFFGALADRYSKKSVAVSTKYIEVGVMMSGGIAFMVGSPVLLWGTLFLMATQSTMFGPAKYGILPEILPEKDLSAGNGIIQMTTIIAIIAGVGLAGPVYTATTGTTYYVPMVLICFSMMGLLTSYSITRPAAANPGRSLPMNPFLPWSGMGQYFKVIYRDKILLNVVIGYCYFWFAGVMARNSLLILASNELEVSDTLASLFLVSISVGIGLGALSAGFLSRGKIEMGLVPIGAFGMTVFAILLWISPATYQQFIVNPVAHGVSTILRHDVNLFEAGNVSGGYYLLLQVIAFGLGYFAGIFDVPLAAALQQRAPASMKGGVIATTNMLTFLGMAMASLLLMGVSSSFTASQIFLLIAIMTSIIGIYVMYRLPLLVVRAVLWVFANTICRIKVMGRDNIPEDSGALFVANHLSAFDALMILASTDCHVRFVAGQDLWQRPRWKRIADMIGMIPIDPDGGDAAHAELLQTMRTAVSEGQVVCISLNSARAKDGKIPKVLTDYDAIVADLDAPIVPVHLDRLWGRVYTFENDRFRFAKRIRKSYPITVNYGVPLDSADTQCIRKAIQLLGSEAYKARPLAYICPHHAFVRVARRNMRRIAIADLTTGPLSFFKTLVGSIAFALKLKAVLGNEKMVGLLVPPTVGGTLTNIALQFLGKVAVNLNYTSSNETLASCVKQCEIRQVLTSRKFLERVPNLVVPGETVFLEDIKESIQGKDRVKAMLMALLLPVSMIEKILGAPKRTEDDICTVVFSSGSEGDPKGIMLTYRNVMSNIEAVLEVFPHHDNSCIIGYLPFFHSFGYTVTLWMPLVRGIRGVYHPNPLEPKLIGSLSKKYDGSIMIGTSTFLQAFIRRCTLEQFEKLEFVVTGAEKLAPRVREAFREKFGVEPLEGYGTTECAPSVSVNFPDLHSPGFVHIGTKHGTIGCPMPGQSAMIVDPDTREELGTNASGLLRIKGPNIMKGYLNQPEKTDAVLQDGWYDTGDIAMIDEDGFIKITDRLARFSKIAGEMVPHTTVEERLHEILKLTDQALAIASVSDIHKGERLVVLHTLNEQQLEELLGKLDTAGLPNLWIPRAKAFYRVEEIPVLATGKMDIKAIKKMATALDIGE